MQLNELVRQQGGVVDYRKLVFDYERHADQAAPTPVRRPVAVVGAGPVGLSLAIDLAQRGVPVVVLDNDNTLSTGSRAICFAKRTLEIFDRLGCGDRMADKGVSWSVGKVFFRNEQVYSFDLLPEPGHGRPAFVNLQQYYVEGFLAERAAELPLVDVRWKNAVSGAEQHDDHVTLTIDTPDGPYQLAVDYVAACDGSRSTMRRLLGLESRGRSFRDRFLIADVRMKHEAPAERWFWFDPEFHPNQSVLLHRQPDGVWRIDFQLGWDADPEEEKKPEKILPRVKALLAHSAMKDFDFELEWASVYTFSCLRMDKFRHGHVLFAGDSAHGVSPFGARGANSGVQDADNLAWKLAAVLQHGAPDALLDTYGVEREQAADAPVLLRDGRASWLLQELGAGFTVLVAATAAGKLAQVDGHGLDVKVLAVDAANGDLVDTGGLLAKRYDLRPDTVYLLRPDQHVCARWRATDADEVGRAIRRALAIA